MPCVCVRVDGRDVFFVKQNMKFNSRKIHTISWMSDEGVKIGSITILT